MAGRLYRMAKVVSANPASWGIVDANQISGFRTVATQADLYSIAACILSSAYGDGTTTGADAVGQIWHVQDTNKDFRLTSWANRGKAAGWAEELTSAKLSEGITNATKVANAAQATANAAKSQATTVEGIAEKNEESITVLQGAVNMINTTVSGHAQNIADINDELTKKANIADLTAFKSTKGQPNGLAPLDVNGNVPLKNLGNLDTTLFEVVSELPSTIATIKKHIYLKAAGITGDKNNYAEYIYTGNLTATYDATKWEKLGEVTASVDLSGYYTKAEIDKKVTAIDKNSISSLLIGKQDSTDAVSVVLKRAGGENTLSTPIPVVNNNSDNHHNGLMSPAMLTKLNGIAEGANKYTHPVRNAAVSEGHGLYKITVDELGHVSKTTAVDKSDIASLAPDLTMTPKYSSINVSVIAHYNGDDKIATIAEASNGNAGVMSTSMYEKLHAIADGATRNEVKNEVTATGTDAVSGKAVYTAINTHKITGSNLADIGNSTQYTVIALDDSNSTTIGPLTDILYVNNNPSTHSTLVIDGATVWDEERLKAITNDELTKILV